MGMLQIPNGQIARLRWKEVDRSKKVGQTDHMLKVSLLQSTMFWFLILYDIHCRSSIKAQFALQKRNSTFVLVKTPKRPLPSFLSSRSWMNSSKILMVLSLFVSIRVMQG